MEDTTASFFDNNKLYIKSVQQEAQNRGKKSTGNSDPLYVDTETGTVNKQAF